MILMKALCEIPCLKMTISLLFYCVVTRSQFKSNFDYGSERAGIHIIVVKTASSAEKFNSNLEH